MPHAFVNGRFVPASELTLAATDAGFVSGVTVTDFCRTYRHRLFRWPDHLARFLRDCAACRVPLRYTDVELTLAAERLVSEESAALPATVDLAVITFATPGPLGYFSGHPENGPPTLGMHTFPLAARRYRRFFTEGVLLAVAGVNPLAGAGIVTPGAKHRNRLAWWLAEQAVTDSTDPRFCPGAVAVLTDADGLASDTAIGSVVSIRNNTIRRSPVGWVLESVSLGVLKELAEVLGLHYAEMDQSVTDLSTADELLLVGSGFGVAGVRQFVDEATSINKTFPWPGPQTTRLIDAWSTLVGVDIAEQFKM